MERPYRDSGHRSLAAAYEAHADGIYDYCFWLSGDDEIAAAATHSALIAALGCAGRLEDVTTLRPWLYGAARNECLRLTQPPVTGRRGASSARHSSSGRASRRARFPSRPGRVIAGLSAAEQEIAELSLRHRLTPAEIAATLGRPMPAVRRAVMQVYTTLALKCGDNVAERFAAPPAAPMPNSLYADLIDSAAIRSRVSYHADRSRPHRRNGYPAPIDRSPLRVRPVPAMFAAAVVASLLVVGTMSYRPTTSSQAAPRPTPSSTPTPAPTTTKGGATFSIGLPETAPTQPPTSPGVVPVSKPVPTSPSPRPSASGSASATPSPPALSCPSTGWPTDARRSERRDSRRDESGDYSRRAADATCWPVADDDRGQR